MNKVFISSVIEEFEGFRHAVKEAVEAAGMTTIMVEDLSAQPCSSEQLCIKGVQEADLVVVIWGKRYGYETDAGISVTHKEYKEAIKLHKPVLAFVQDIEKELKQQGFVEEVENYGDGLFRKKFSSPDELRGQIESALDNWKKSQASNDEGAFLQKVDKAIAEHHLRGHHRNLAGSPWAMVAFWGQPDQELDLEKIDCDDEFHHLCKLGVMSAKNGYNNGYNTGGHYKLIQSQKEGDTYRTKVVFYDDGLTLLIFMPKIHMRVATCFISPSEFESIAKEALCLNRFNSSWSMLGLYDMGATSYFSEPVGSVHNTSSNIPFRIDTSKPTDRFCHLFNPLTKGAYLNWIESRIKSFEREFKLPKEAKCW